jgi:hypothetical protein
VRRSGRALRPELELGAVVLAVATDLWLLRGGGYPPLERILVWAAVVAVIATSIARRRARPEAAVVGRARAWSEAALATAVLADALLALGAFARAPWETFDLDLPGTTPRLLGGWALTKLTEAAGQQLALQLFLGPVCREVMASVLGGNVLAALVFASFHLPSLALGGATLVAAVVWLVLYRRGRLLAPLVLSHVVLAVLIHAALPPRWTYDLWVGVRAWRRIEHYRVLDQPEARRRLAAVASPEFYARSGGDDRSFVAALYRDLLGRAADPAGLEYWVSELRGRSREALIRKFVMSEEFLERWRPPRAGGS